ncbi:hypothetical protein [Nocardioides lijunqiniae]|uniref:hypothetical protein n=1 Tax=Nocardioides lijunqiniae TaxID=2760832 RepID=UPI001878D166|nr:hypothetical protein [Nocardioides lijunqiniae]
MSRLVAAAALAGAVLVWPSSAPVQAAGCSSSSGVTVVVDFAGLNGGGVQSGCVGSGGDARRLFGAAGVALTDVADTPGFVCRVSGVPERSCATTPPASSYWGLWWADGRGGGWVYASQGVDSLTVPNGGYVAFAWDAVDGSPKPRFDPAKHAAAPSPSPAPSPGGSGGGGNGGGSSGGNAGSAGNGNGEGGQSSGGGTAGGQGGGATNAPGPSASPSPSAQPSASASASPGAAPAKPAKPGRPGKSRTPRTTPSPSASPGATTTPEAADGELTGTAPTAAEPQDDGLPTFVAPLLIGVLFAAAGVVLLLRRRSGPA